MRLLVVTLAVICPVACEQRNTDASDRRSRSSRSTSAIAPTGITWFVMWLSRKIWRSAVHRRDHPGWEHAPGPATRIAHPVGHRGVHNEPLSLQQDRIQERSQ